MLLLIKLNNLSSHEEFDTSIFGLFFIMFFVLLLTWVENIKLNKGYVIKINRLAKGHEIEYTFDFFLFRKTHKITIDKAPYCYYDNISKDIKLILVDKKLFRVTVIKENVKLYNEVKELFTIVE